MYLAYAMLSLSEYPEMEWHLVPLFSISSNDLQVSYARFFAGQITRCSSPTIEISDLEDEKQKDVGHPTFSGMRIRTCMP
jgi:hypothetical protein